MKLLSDTLHSVLIMKYKNSNGIFTSTHASSESPSGR